MKRFFARILLPIVMLILLAGCSGKEAIEGVKIADYDVTVVSASTYPEVGTYVDLNLKGLIKFSGKTNIRTAVLTTGDGNDYAITSDVYVGYSFDWQDPETKKIPLYFMTMEQPKELYLEIERVGDDSTAAESGCFDMQTKIGRVLEGGIPFVTGGAFDKGKLKNWFGELSPEEFSPAAPEPKNYIVFVKPVIHPTTQGEVTGGRIDWTTPESAADILGRMEGVDGLILTDNPDTAKYAYVVSLAYTDAGPVTFSDGSSCRAYDAVYTMELRNLISGEKFDCESIADAVVKGFKYNAEQIKGAANRQVYGFHANPTLSRAGLMEFISFDVNN